MAQNYNRAAAFMEYCNGSGLEDIAQALAIPMNCLERWHHDENWTHLARRVSTGLPVKVSEDMAERAGEKIKENRAKNFAVARALQEDLIETVQKLRLGKLKVKKSFANGLTVELDPGLRDRNDLALYARNVAELSYRALGDIAESAKNAGGEREGGGPGQITIILPPAVAAPRQERQELAYDVDSQVVRLDKPGLVEVPEDAQAVAPASAST